MALNTMDVWLSNYVNQPHKMLLTSLTVLCGFLKVTEMKNVQEIGVAKHMCF